MIPIWVVLLAVFYAFTLFFVFSFSLAQLHLVYNYLTKNNYNNLAKLNNHDKNLPFVTIQLPIYNEIYVVERLLNSVSKVEYPKNKLEIQVLDDSTDQTSEILKIKIKELKSLGFDIIHIQRKLRTGYKAGALAHGLQFAKGEYIAIFDADFIINPQFLNETLPYFNADNIGMVQTKWLHINENYSLLTKLQAFGLDAHFTIDQAGRNKAGLLSNFNGTGGIWRKTCIDDAGGWSADCLTEDLDLSYRAQLNGWVFKYLEHTGNFAELPAEIQSVKSQQFRWAKGAAEVARKMLLKILKTKKLSLATKIHSFFHLMNSATYLGLMFTAILIIPTIYLQKKYPQISQFISFAQYFQISFVFLGIYFWVAFKQKNNNFLYFLGFYPRFLAFMMGLALYNSFGVLQGYFGKKSPFIRTPKFNIKTTADNWVNKNYVAAKVDFFFIFEGILCLYFSISLFYIVKNHIWGSFPFLIMLLYGYASVFGYGIYHRYFGKK